MKKILIWAGSILGGLIAVVVLAVVVLYLIGTSRVNEVYEVELAAVPIPSGPAAVERGKHLVESIGLCVECHGENLAGDILEDDPVFGTLAPSNLTSGRGGVGGEYTDAQFVRAIRNGINKDGNPLAIMPSNYYNVINDEDVGAIVAYLKSLPPVDNEQAETKLGPLGRILTVVEKELLPAQIIDHDAPRPPSVPPGITREYGEYMTTVCAVCHGEHLSGGPVPGESSSAPKAANLTTLGQSWSESDFVQVLRTGATPYGKQLDPEMMPWNRFNLLDDVELQAIWLFIRALEPREFEQ